MPKNRWISDLHWVREGQQSRSQQTQQALLDAAAELFAERGIEATTVADIARRAGCSVGAVYHHFRDKQAILYALVDRFTEETLATTRAAVDPARWEGARIADILQGYLQFMLTGPPGMAAVKQAVMEAARMDPALGSHLGKMHKTLNSAITRLIKARASEIGHPEPDLAIAFVLDQLATTLKARSAGIPGVALAFKRSNKTFIEQSLVSVCSYLQIAPPTDSKD